MSSPEKEWMMRFLLSLISVKRLIGELMLVCSAWCLMRSSTWTTSKIVQTQHEPRFSVTIHSVGLYAFLVFVISAFPLNIRNLFIKIDKEYIHSHCCFRIWPKAFRFCTLIHRNLESFKHWAKPVKFKIKYCRFEKVIVHHKISSCVFSEVRPLELSQQ